MPNATLKEVWPWFLRSKIRKFAEKIGLKFFQAYLLLRVNNQTIQKFSEIQANSICQIQHV